MRKEASEKLAAVEPERLIRDPYVLEFLDLEDYPALRESKVEQAIIDNLQAFLLELGKGFAFIARQRRMRFEADRSQGRQPDAPGHRPDGRLRAHVRCPCAAAG